MTVAHFATVGAVRSELGDVEAEVADVEAKLTQTRQEAAEAHKAGTAVLAALEAAMAPLMAELSAAWMECSKEGLDPLEPLAYDDVGPADPMDSVEELEVQVRHLELDISHFQDKAERMQVEERQRGHEMKRLEVELREVQESLEYEKTRMRHHHVSKMKGFVVPDNVWGGLGPSGMGRRTMEVNAEKKLRETAEKRSSKLSRDVTKLAGDAAAKQAAVAQLSRKLSRLRRANEQREKQIHGASGKASELHCKVQLATRGLEDFQKRGADEVVEVEKPAYLDGLDPNMKFPVKRGQPFNSPATKPKKKVPSSSTGKLPQLSF